MGRNILFIFAIILLLIWGAYMLYGNQILEFVNNLNLDNTSYEWEYSYYDDSIYSQYDNSDYYVDFIYPKEYLSLEEINFPIISENLLAVIAIPDTYFSNTNLSEAYFILGANKDQAVTGKCLTAVAGETRAGTREINGHTFGIYKSLDAAAGNRYETTSYRLYRSDVCYEAITYLHYGLFENYDPNLGIQEFDRADIENRLNNILMQLHID